MARPFNAPSRSCARLATAPRFRCVFLSLLVAGCAASLAGVNAARADEPRPLTIAVTIDRGQDLGQTFGSLFEATTDDGQFVIGAGFQDGYNTRLRNDRHVVQFYVRPTGGERTLASEPLPRPNTLCGTYLYARDGVVRSTYGGVRAWDSASGKWIEEAGAGGTHETMRVGNRTLEFGESQVSCDGKVVLGPPDQGSYQLFYYANGYLCFYHVNRRDREYRPYLNDEDGFSRLYACPWRPEEPKVDLSKAVTLTLPVVGETTFAWGQLGDQVVTGSNIGGFYVLEKGEWRILRQPKLGVSYQLYSTIVFHDRLLMGQYPTGRLFEYDGKTIVDRTGWPPVLEGVSGSSREAQTTAIYAGELFVGVWPWGEVWRYHPDQRKWQFVRRMIDHPALSTEVTHPYDVENRGHEVSNLWGQRITSLVPNGPDLFVSTSAKYPCEWSPERFPFLSPDRWKSYGSVHRLTMPGHLGASVPWTAGPTTLEFVLQGTKLSILQDGRTLAETTLSKPLADKLKSVRELKQVGWGNGIHGKFNGHKLDGRITQPN